MLSISLNRTTVFNSFLLQWWKCTDGSMPKWVQNGGDFLDSFPVNAGYYSGKNVQQNAFCAKQNL